MPAFGDNANVACYMDDLYVYLRARANDAVGARVRASMKTRPTRTPRPKMAAWGGSKSYGCADDSMLNWCCEA